MGMQNADCGMKFKFGDQKHKIRLGVMGSEFRKFKFQVAS